ncbi:MAG: RNA methyltransferase [Bacillota bacterium]|jgi:TrmH family RNA methyltransferase|nr:RNA methyltransferase [Bacillota bacterium]NLL25891.1 RNA methyltransferase [Erysipelotrichia bacterium]
MEIIRSLENSKIKNWSKLKQKKYRDKYKLFIVQERHLIEEAIKAGCIDTLIVKEKVENIFEMDCVYVSDAVMRKLSVNVSLNDYIAVCRMLDYKVNDYKKAIILEKVQDPGNVGTIIRTAYSFGYDVVFLTVDSCDLYNEKTIQASQGAFFHLPVIRDSFDNILSNVRKKGCRVIATDLDNSNYLSKSKKTDRLAIMLGNEGQGLSEKALLAADERVKIEMENFESLNVAIAAAIVMYYYKC